MFDRLRKEKPDFADRIRIVEGNVEQPLIGMSTADHEWIVENVNLVFHCAATVKFDEKIDVAAKINVQGTEKMLALATEMKHLEVKHLARSCDR